MNNKSKRVEARMSGELYKRLAAEAAKKGCSVSQLVNVFVQRGLNRK